MGAASWEMNLIYFVLSRMKTNLELSVPDGNCKTPRELGAAFFCFPFTFFIDHITDKSVICIKLNSIYSSSACIG